MANLTVQDIIILCEQAYGARYLIDETTIIKYINVIQKAAFDKDLDYFVNWSYYIDTQADTLTYTMPDGSDEDIPMGRKIIGVTTLTDRQLLGYNIPIGSSLPGLGIDDYGFYTNYTTSFDPDRFKWLPGRINNLDGTFTFLEQPTIDDATYRMVYYREAPVIADSSDDANLLIPDRFRHSLLVQGVGVLANNALYGDAPATPEQLLKPYLDSFWNSIIKNNGPQPGGNSYLARGFDA